MFGRLFVAVVVLLGAILWLDPSVLLDGLVWVAESAFDFGVGLAKSAFGAVEQAIRDAI